MLHFCIENLPNTVTEQLVSNWHINFKSFFLYIGQSETRISCGSNVLSDQNEMMSFCRGPHKHHPSKIYFNWQSSFSGEDIFYIGQSETRLWWPCFLSIKTKNKKRNFVEDLLSIGL